MNKIKIAIVGTNGHQILDSVSKSNQASLAGIAEIEPAVILQWEKARSELLKIPRFDSVEDLLQKTDCELVSICSTRRDQQGKKILACLNAGRHVLAEKPLCTSLAELEEIRRTAKKVNRKVWAMLAMIYSPVFRDFERRVRSGELGEIAQVYAQKSYKFGPHGRRTQDRGVDGGIIQAVIHAVSFVRSTTGLEFTEVSALESSVGNPEKGELQMEFGMTARLNNGALCQIIANYLNPASAPFWGNDQLRIFGTNGMVETVDGLTRSSVLLKDGLQPLEINPEHDSLYLSDLLNELSTGKSAYLTMEDSLRCTQIVLEAQQSADGNGMLRPVHFNV